MYRTTLLVVFSSIIEVSYIESASKHHCTFLCEEKITNVPLNVMYSLNVRLDRFCTSINHLDTLFNTDKLSYHR